MREKRKTSEESEVTELPHRIEPPKPNQELVPWTAALGLLIIAGFVFSVYFCVERYQVYLDKVKVTERIAADIKRLQEENRQLEETIRRYKAADSQLLERAGREKLNMTKKGELILPLSTKPEAENQIDYTPQ